MVLTLIASSSNNLLAEQDVAVKERVIYGWVEWVQLQPYQMSAKAKLDTGAKTSSMHAKNIEWFEKDGNDWVRFQFSPNTKLTSKRILSGKTKNFVTIEAPVVRSTRIKQHKRASVERPVIMHKITLDGVEHDVEFTLTDRSRFIYPILFGRRFLGEAAIVDPARTYLRTRPVKADPAPEKKAAEPEPSAAEKKSAKTTKTTSDSAASNKP